MSTAREKELQAKMEAVNSLMSGINLDDILCVLSYNVGCAIHALTQKPDVPKEARASIMVAALMKVNEGISGAVLSLEVAADKKGPPDEREFSA